MRAVRESAAVVKSIDRGVSCGKNQLKPSEGAGKRAATKAPPKGPPKTAPKVAPKVAPKIAPKVAAKKTARTAKGRKGSKA